MNYTPQSLIAYAIELLIFLIIADVIISIAMSAGARLSPSSGPVKLVRAIVTPVLNPLRKLLPPPYKTGGLDFSPMIAIILLQLLQQAIYRI